MEAISSRLNSCTVYSMERFVDGFSYTGIKESNSVPVLDIHELAAGKLTAPICPKQTRDLFDSHKILSMHDLDLQGY